MTNKAICKKPSFDNINRFFYKIRRKTLGILFAAFIFTFFHTTVHNSFDHKHDSRCTVYVLEQFCLGVDIVNFEPLPVLFLPFVFVAVQRHFCYLKLHTAFSIRAPPSYSFYL